MTTALIEQLTAIVGPSHCLTDVTDVAPYLIEERGLFTGQALCVVKPGSTLEVSQVIAACAATGTAIVPMGGNTGLCGGGVPQGSAVVIATERLNRIRSIDPHNRTLTAEAGCVLATLQQAADDAGLLFPLSLGAEGSCRIGGNLSTNAGGINVLRYGNARELALGLEVVLPDGQIWDGLKGLRKDNTGYDLKHLFIGAEGTLGIITAAVLKLFPKPRSLETALVAIPNPQAAIQMLSLARDMSGDSVTGCELIPQIGLQLWLAHLPNARSPFDTDYDCHLLIELASSRSHGLTETMEEILAEAFERGLAVDAVIARSETQRRSLWRIREEIPEAQKREGASIKNDVAVPISSVPDFIERASLAVERIVPGVRVVAFGHVGDGNIHFNLSEPKDGDRQAFLARWEELAMVVNDIVVDMGGSFSAEHGIGALKRNEMARLKPQIDLDLMRNIKSAFDPQNIMNPGKVLP